MSADNGVILTNHPQGGYTLLHYFASADRLPEPTADCRQFDTLLQALITYEVEEREYPSEYGLLVRLAENSEEVVCNCYSPRTNIHFEDCAVIRAAMAESHW